MLHVLFGLSGLDELISLDPGSRFLGNLEFQGLVDRVGGVDWLVGFYLPVFFILRVGWLVGWLVGVGRVFTLPDFVGLFGHLCGV